MGQRDRLHRPRHRTSGADCLLVGHRKDGGLKAAAGDQLLPKGGGSPVSIDAAGFDSSDGATAAQACLHAQDLQQPCATACTVKGIPGGTAVHQVPIDPNAAGGFEAFVAEFTIGSDLFYAYAKGNPG